MFGFCYLSLLMVILNNLPSTKLEFPGWHPRAAIPLEERLGSILFLTCSGMLAGIAFWYPWYLCTYHAAPDDRYGFVLMYAMPLWFLGPGMAGVALVRLLQVVRRPPLTIPNLVIAVCGIALALPGCSPILTMLFRSLLFHPPK